MLIAAFILFVFPLGLVIASITPPGHVDDEPAHMCRAFALLHGGVIGTRQNISASDGRVMVAAGVRVDPAIIEASFGPLTPRTPAAFAAKSALRWTHRLQFIPINPIAVYFPIFYVPAAFGLEAARIIGMRPFESVYAGRLVSYVCYFTLGLLALALARRGQAVIFLALSMPMGLALGASCNPDGLLIATTALGTALFSRGAWKPAAVCLAMVILVKPPYALIALILLLPLPPVRGWFASRRLLLSRLMVFVMTLLPAMAWFFYAMAMVAAPTIWPDYHPGPLWPGNPATLFHTTNPAAQLQSVLTHPLKFLQMVWVYFSVQPDATYLVKSAIGILGWLIVLLPPSIYKLWILGAVGAVIADIMGRAGPVATPRDTILLGVVIAVTIILVWLSQYLNWTRVGMAEIDGPSGRYLLPLLPILGLALPQIKLPGRASIRFAASFMPASAAVGTLILLPRWLAMKFYLN